MTILWDKYIFRRGAQVQELWEEMFANRSARVLYIAGCGFDVRVTAVLQEFLECKSSAGICFESATLGLIEFSGYELDDDLKKQTVANSQRLRELFENVGEVSVLPMKLADSSADFRVSHALQSGTQSLLKLIGDHTDVILDVSSLPRIVYLAMMTGILDYLIADKGSAYPLAAGGVNFQVLVAEDARLDGSIRSEDPSEDLVMIPGFRGGVKVEAMAEWPVVWFPILGEGRAGQFEKVVDLAEIPNEAEICPILPHPSRDPRRGDNLLIEYREQLFNSRRPTSVNNIMFAHESHPFEAYRQMQGAIGRYRMSLSTLGGCRLLVTPLSSKLMTIAAGLACYEMKPTEENTDYALGIPCAAPTRYVVSIEKLLASKPEISALLLTGHAYMHNSPAS
jgi:hypothetical protein